jgi:hypothetical protein
MTRNIEKFSRNSFYIYKVSGALLLVMFVTASIVVTNALGNKVKQLAFPRLLAIPLLHGTPLNLVYLPMITSPGENTPIGFSDTPRINIPYFPGDQVNYHQAAIFWFGQVRDTENYADVRIGYHTQGLYVRLSVIDRHLWYDVDPVIQNLSLWDAVTLYLDMDGNHGTQLSPAMYRFIGQLETKTDQTNRQVVYQGSSTGWKPVPLTFYTSSGWKGDGPNNPGEDRGYVLTFHIPFSSLGLSAPPEEVEGWGLALTLHDRDDAAGTTLSKKHWPQAFNPQQSLTWGQISFGLPSSGPLDVPVSQKIILRHGQDGIVVKDAVVGGNTTCGDEFDFWTEWGDGNYAGAKEMNVQNQGNIDDWPCFSKFYLTFPLDSPPPGKTVVSATLTLHQSGNSTGFEWDPPEALNSLVQVMEVEQEWDEALITWNNAPLVLENLSQAWVGPITMADWGIGCTWDLSRAVGRAYATGKPLRLVVYSSDHYGPNGKYFISSDHAAWDITLRPTLEVLLGER